MVKLIEQLQSPKLWSVLIGLLVSAGLIQFSDSQAGEVVGALTALFTALGVIAQAVMSQKGDNDTNVEMARGVSREIMAREITQFEHRGTSIEPDVTEHISELWDEFDRVKLRVRELEQGRTVTSELERVRRRELDNAHG